MNAKASYRSIESLKLWFMQSHKPYFSIWTGFSKDTKDLAFRNSAIDDLEDSWNLLEQIITDKTAGGGKVTIFVTEVKNSSAGYTEYLEIAGNNNTAIAGPSNLNNNFIGGINEYIADKMAMYDKDRQIEELKAQISNKDEGTGVNKLFNRLLEEAPIAELIMALCAKFLGTGITPAINGPKKERITEDLEEEILSENDQMRMQNAIHRLSIHFPDIVQAMEKLADFVESNPSLAKSFIK